MAKAKEQDSKPRRKPKAPKAPAPAEPTAVAPERRPNTGEWRPIFVRSLATNGNVRLACRAAGIARSLAYRVRDEDAAFRAEWDEALDEAMDLLEGIAFARAANPNDKHSARLIEFLLKAHRPDKYGDRLDLRNSVPLTAEIVVDLVPRVSEE
jgi:hypothetical protein